MFRKLRLKLTLINLGFIALLLLLFVVSTYFIMQFQVFNQSLQLLQVITNDLASGSITDIRKHDQQVAKYFYVKTDNSGQITNSSANLPPAAELSLLVKKALHDSGSKGQEEVNDQTYTFLKSPQQPAGFIITFINVERDREILEALLLTLSVGGVVCLGLSYYGGRFLADRAMAPIKSSWQRQQDFVTDASHELRTPLTVVQLNLDIVKGNPEESVASQAKWLDNSLLELRRLSGLVDDLLFLARADSQQQTLNLQTFPLQTALKEVFESFQPLAQTKGIILESSLDSAVLYYGDENRIKQMVVILLDNALKYTHAGGKVSLDLRNWGTLTEITVADSGEGIPKEQLDRIFERFYRVDQARSQAKEGSGLGLAIADWIIRSHHGRIRVSSSLGKGTTFLITLPHRKDSL